MIAWIKRMWARLQKSFAVAQDDQYAPYIDEWTKKVTPVGEQPSFTP